MNNESMDTGSLPPPTGYERFEEPAAAWPEIDPVLLEDSRGGVPDFPLEVLPPHWRRWVRESAEAAGAPIDYVAQGLLASVAAVCGAGMMTRIIPAWSEPLVLWQALVGTPSSGKSPALAVVRELLDAVESRLRCADAERRSRHNARLEEARALKEQWEKDCRQAHRDGEPQPALPAGALFEQPFVAAQIVVGDATLEALADVVSGNPRGVVLWRDELTAWLANLGRYANGGSDRAHWLEAWAAAGTTINRRSRKEPLFLRRFPVSVIGSIQPDRIAEVLHGSDDGMAARFLFSWPDAAPHRPLAERLVAWDDAALGRLQSIADAAGTAEQPRVLALDPMALALFDNLLHGLHFRIDKSEGLEAGWLGKGKGTIARLAAALYLLAWSEGAREAPPEAIGMTAMSAAAELWTCYFGPHARAVFNRAGRTDRDRDARRALRWLQHNKVAEVTREELRRDALYQSLDSQETDRVVGRLVEASVLRLLPPARTGGPGRPARRWEVHPALRG
jgi:hypothetical protein